MYNVLGIDDGFGDFKGKKGDLEIFLPNFVHKFVPKPDNGIDGDYSEPHSHITVEYGDDIRKLVGYGAQNLNPKAKWQGVENKHNFANDFDPLFKTMLTLLTENGPDQDDIDVLVMGLPVKQYVPERIALLKKLTEKPHEMKVTLADGTIIQKAINIKKTFITDQAFGTTANYLLQDDGSVTDSVELSKITIVFDLGARTWNLTASRGFTPIPEINTTLNEGMYEAWLGIQSDIEINYGKSINIARIPQYVQSGFISNDTDIRKIVEENYQIHAQSLVGELDKKLIHIKSEIDTIILTGGGCDVLRKYITPILKANFPRAEIVNEGRFSCVRGYHKLANRSARETYGKSRKKS